MSLRKIIFLTVFCIKTICNSQLPVLDPERNSVGANRLARQIATITTKKFKSLLRQKLNPASPLKTDYGRMTLYGYLLFSERFDLAQTIENHPNFLFCPKELVDLCSKRDFNIATAFKCFNIGVNDLIADGNTALHRALTSRWPNHNVIVTLLWMGANIESKNFKGENARYLAALTGNFNFLLGTLDFLPPITEETAMKIGSINNFYTASSLKNICQMTQNHALYLGILKGYLENRLLTNAENFYIPNHTDPKNMAEMLLQFALEGNIQAVNFLLERGIKLPRGYSPDTNPFSEDIIVLLCDKGFRPKFPIFLKIQ